MMLSGLRLKVVIQWIKQYLLIIMSTWKGKYAQLVQFLNAFWRSSVRATWRIVRPRALMYLNKNINILVDFINRPFQGYSVENCFSSKYRRLWCPARRLNIVVWHAHAYVSCVRPLVNPTCKPSPKPLVIRLKRTTFFLNALLLKQGDMCEESTKEVWRGQQEVHPSEPSLNTI